jgi:hypothetical protein
LNKVLKNITDGGLSCAKSVVEGLAGFNPSGILTIAKITSTKNLRRNESSQARDFIDNTNLNI